MVTLLDFATAIGLAAGILCATAYLALRASEEWLPAFWGHVTAAKSYLLRLAIYLLLGTSYVWLLYSGIRQGAQKEVIAALVPLTLFYAMALATLYTRNVQLEAAYRTSTTGAVRARVRMHPGRAITKIIWHARIPVHAVYVLCVTIAVLVWNALPASADPARAHSTVRVLVQIDFVPSLISAVFLTLIVLALFWAEARTSPDVRAMEQLVDGLCLAGDSIQWPSGPPPGGRGMLVAPEEALSSLGDEMRLNLAKMGIDDVNNAILTGPEGWRVDAAELVRLARRLHP